MFKPMVLAVTSLGFLTSAAAPCAAQSVRVDPADVRGIRDLGSGPFLLGFLAIKAGTEDRTVMEFQTPTMNFPPPWAYLELGISNIDPGPPDGVIDVFIYTGDGVVHPSEFYAGGYYSSFIYNDGPGLAQVDVTGALQLTGRYLGVRLSTITPDRFWLGAIISQPDPVLVVGACYADCDRSTGDGVLDIFDFLCFANRFAMMDPYACDCDISGTFPCDIFDFLCFGQHFQQGCP